MLLNKTENNISDIKLVVLVSILMFLWSSGLQLRVLQLHEKYQILKLTAVLLIVIVSIVLIMLKGIGITFKNIYFKYCIGIILLVMLPTYFTGVLFYGFSLIEVFRLPLRYYAFFIFPILLLSKRSDNFLYKLNTVIIIYAIILATIQIISSLLPGIAEKMLVDSATVSPRFDRTRLTVTSAMHPCIQYSFIYLLISISQCSKFSLKNTIHIVFIVLLAYYILFVAMDRKIILGFIIIMTIYRLIFFSLGKNIPFFIIALLIISLIELLTNGIFITMLSDIKDSILYETQEVQGNVGIRIRGIQYNLEEFKRTGFIGTGIVSSERALTTNLGIGMSLYRFNPSDQGLIGVFIRFGLQAIIMTGIIVYTMVNDLKVAIQSSNPKIKILATSILVYLLLRLIILTYMFFWHYQSIWWGIFFFMTWELKRQYSLQKNEY